MKKKRYISTIISLLFIFVLIGCGNAKQSAYQWDGTLKGCLKNDENSVSYLGLTTNYTYKELITSRSIIHDFKEEQKQFKNYGVTVRQESKFTDFLSGEIVVRYAFSSETDKLQAVTLYVTKYDDETWIEFNERLATYLEDNMKDLSKETQKENGTKKEEGYEIRDDITYMDSSGSSIHVSFGSTVEITVRYET